MEVRYLGYYTDAGAYYYYHTEDNMNYDQVRKSLYKKDQGKFLSMRSF